jgi:hypothetical protein
LDLFNICKNNLKFSAVLTNQGAREAQISVKTAARIDPKGKNGAESLAGIPFVYKGNWLRQRDLKVVQTLMKFSLVKFH